LLKPSARNAAVVNFHSKRVNWVAAKKAWHKAGVNLSVDYMKSHWKQICENEGGPSYRLGPLERQVTPHGHEKRPVAFALTAPGNEKQHRLKSTTLAPPEKVDFMKRDEAYPSKYLKAADLNGEDLTVVIKSLEDEQIGKDKKIGHVLYFRGGKTKPLIVNVTNFDAIVSATGLDDSDDWEGKKITLFVDEVPFQGKMVDAIRVRGRPSKKAKAEPEPPEDTVPF